MERATVERLLGDVASRLSPADLEWLAREAAAIEQRCLELAAVGTADPDVVPLVVPDRSEA